MKLTTITTVNELTILKQTLLDKEYAAYDCETTGLTKRHQVIGYSICAGFNEAFYVILGRWDGTSLVMNDEMVKASVIFLRFLSTKSLIMHNAVFDCMMAEAFFKVSLIQAVHTDTMILAHLLDENRKVGLKELAKQYFGDSSTQEAAEMKASVLSNGGEWTSQNKEMYKADPAIMAKYGAQDAGLTFRLFHTLVPELYGQKLDTFFYEEESMPLLRSSTYELNTIGLKVDVTKLQTLKKTLEVECLEAKAFIEAETLDNVKDKYPGTKKNNGFNIGSSSQLAWLLFGKMALEFGSLTKEGKNLCRSLGLKLPYWYAGQRSFISIVETSKNQTYVTNGVLKKIRDPWCYIQTDKKTLQKLASRFKWVASLLEYNYKRKLLSTYVEGIEEKIQYGVIQPSFLQHGTTSGRYASRNPNFQNLPRDDKRIKACIVPRPGCVFVGADYSQLEPRIFAYVSKDAKLLEAFESGDDFYSTIGIEVYGKHECTPKKDSDPKAFGLLYKDLRDLSKIIALATVYGASAYQLASTTKKSVEDTQLIIDAYFLKFPGVARMMLESHEQAKATGRVENAFGRIRRIPDAMKINKMYGPLPHAELPYTARGLLNLSTNFRIQSTAASIVNRASIKFIESCKEAGIECKLVLQVHDSLIAECKAKDGEEVAKLMQVAMETAVDLKTIRLEAIPKIGNSLGEV